MTDTTDTTNTTDTTDTVNVSDSSDQTLNQQPDPQTILCKVVDVNLAIQNSFKRFIEADSKTLEDLVLFLREEMSHLELFAPNLTSESAQELFQTTT